MLKDFKAFIMKGNVIDLAVAVVIGAAFKSVIDAAVSTLIMPVVAAIFGQPTVGGISVTLRTFDPPKVINGVTYSKAALQIGAFIDVLIQFVIIAFALFIVVKSYEKLQERRNGPNGDEPEDPTPTEALLMEIRDTLREQGEPAGPA